MSSKQKPSTSDGLTGKKVTKNWGYVLILGAVLAGVLYIRFLINDTPEKGSATHKDSAHVEQTPLSWWTVHISSNEQWESALNDSLSLVKQGFTCFIERGKLFRVFSGCFQTDSLADLRKQRLEAAGWKNLRTIKLKRREAQ